MIPFVSITMTIPDLRRGKITAVWKEAIDGALLNHRNTYLPLHFETAAIVRYGRAYRVTKSGGGPAYGLKKHLDGMSKEDQREFWAVRTAARRVNRMFGGMSQAERDVFSTLPQSEKERIVELAVNTPLKRGRRKGGAADPSGKVPLVNEGLARSMVLQGSPQFGLPVQRRRMRIRVPRYMKTVRPNQINKEEALLATIAQELGVFGTVVSRRLQQHFQVSTIRLP